MWWEDTVELVSCSKVPKAADVGDVELAGKGLVEGDNGRNGDLGVNFGQEEGNGEALGVKGEADQVLGLLDGPALETVLVSIEEIVGDNKRDGCTSDGEDGNRLRSQIDGRREELGEGSVGEAGPGRGEVINDCLKSCVEIIDELGLGRWGVVRVSLVRIWGVGVDMVVLQGGENLSGDILDRWALRDGRGRSCLYCHGRC